MQQYNIDSYGGVLYVNFGQDISAATEFSLELKPQYGDTQDLTPTLGTTDIWVGSEKLLANQYVKYTTTSDMFKTGVDSGNYAQLWRKKATATISASDVRATQFSEFRVTK